ncbi:MAG TPA: DUF5818 domain-containing protein [Terracidiphilus sp.]|jgi:uncharacterized protein YdeI (BOF family)
MRPIHFIKRGLFRDLLLGIAASAFVFVCALAWGGPFLSTVANAAPTQTQGQHATFTGTVMRNGEQFVLRDTSGQIYRLDDPRHAQPFEGKAVKITGSLDAEAHLIHVERIESAMA